MDEMVYDALSRYFHALELKGYIPYSDVQRVLLLSFYNNFVSSDYRGFLTEGDYHLIKWALDCLYGSTCLIPYPDYLKMGKLHLGSISELASRTKILEYRLGNVENTKVVKSKDKLKEIGDIDVSGMDDFPNE